MPAHRRSRRKAASAPARKRNASHKAGQGARINQLFQDALRDLEDLKQQTSRKSARGRG